MKPFHVIYEAEWNDIVCVDFPLTPEKYVTESIQPFVNTHVGITPMYRGVHGGYWALWNSDPDNFGVTIHLVDTGVDTGQPLRQVRVRPSRDDSFVTYPLLQQAQALDVIKDILSDLPRSLVAKEQPSSNEFSRQWFHPTVGQYLRGRLRGVR